MTPYPLLFKPILKEKIWGGRRLTSLGKTLPDGVAIGESWEIADLENGQSEVRSGPASGRTLGALVRDWGVDLIGSASLFEGRFPLLVKFLDAQQTLSVQVHPDAAMAARLGGDVRVKNEAWYIVDATDDGFIYKGLKPGVTPEALRSAIADGTVESLMNRIPVRKGHCHYLPSGTLHALGAGVLVAEIQTPSDTTYRVYDFNRVDEKTGRTRELHVEQALECIHFGATPETPRSRQHVASVWTSVTSLVRCNSFVIERVRMVEGVEQAFAYGEMVVWMVLEGGGRIRCKGYDDPIPFEAGDTVLIPAAVRDGVVSIDRPTMWLEVTVPVTGAWDAPDEVPAQATESPQAQPGRFVDLNPPGSNR